MSYQSNNGDKSVEFTGKPAEFKLSAKMNSGGGGTSYAKKSTKKSSKSSY